MASGRRPSSRGAPGAKKKAASKRSRARSSDVEPSATRRRGKAVAKKRPARRSSGKSSPGPKRAASKKRGRAGGAKAPATTQLPPASDTWAARILRSLTSTLLAVVAAITTGAFLRELARVDTGPHLWTAAPVFFFLLGVALLGVFRFGFPERSLYLYVFGHELTHVIFIFLCGGRVFGDIRVSAKGGHVVTNKSNWLISLSPYFVPFYTVLVILVFALASPLVDLSHQYRVGVFDLQPLYILYTLIGFTWTLHFGYTVSMMTRDQPDLETNGKVVSLLVIYLVNSFVVMAFLAAASRTLSFRGYLESWIFLARHWLNLFLVRIADLIW